MLKICPQVTSSLDKSLLLFETDAVTYNPLPVAIAVMIVAISNAKHNEERIQRAVTIFLSSTAIL